MPGYLPGVRAHCEGGGGGGGAGEGPRRWAGFAGTPSRGQGGVRVTIGRPGKIATSLFFFFVRGRLIAFGVRVHLADA